MFEKVFDLSSQDKGRRVELLKLLLVSVAVASLTLIAAEIGARIFVFVGKPALSANPQFDAKFRVARSINPWQDNIVLCGDSLAKQGLNAELIAARLEPINSHIRVFNLAVDAGSQKDAIAWLNFIRDKCATKPKLLIYDFEVSSTGGETPIDVAKWATRPGYLFSGKLARPSSLIDRCLLMPSDLSMLVRYQGSIKHFIIDFMPSIVNAKLYDLKSFSELSNSDNSWTTYYGTMPDYHLMSKSDVSEMNSRRNITLAHSPQTAGFRFNPEVYSPIINYCQEQHIPLMLVWLPHQNAVYERDWYQAPYTQSWFKQRFEEYAKRMFIFPLYLNDLPPDPINYSDYRHLSSVGAVKASEMMAEAISQPKYRSLIEHTELKQTASMVNKK